MLGPIDFAITLGCIITSLLSSPENAAMERSDSRCTPEPLKVVSLLTLSYCINREWLCFSLCCDRSKLMPIMISGDILPELWSTVAALAYTISLLWVTRFYIPWEFDPRKLFPWKRCCVRFKPSFESRTPCTCSRWCNPWSPIAAVLLTDIVKLH